jgi:hypothetical protein
MQRNYSVLNLKVLMNTRRYPRTLNEAFGPYCDNRIATQPATDWDGIAIVLGVGLCIVAGYFIWG